MDKKKLKLYIILLVLLLGASLLLPFGIDYATNVIVGGILSLSEKESETEIMAETEEWDFEITELETLPCEVDPAVICDEPVEEVISTELETAADAIGETSVDDESKSQSKKKKKKSDNTSKSETQPASEGKTQEELAQQKAYAEDRDEFSTTFNPEIVVLDGASDSYEDFLEGRESDFLKAISDYIYDYYGEIINVTKIELIETVSNNDEECYVQTAIYAGNNYDIFICSYNKLYNYYGVYASQYVD